MNEASDPPSSLSRENCMLSLHSDGVLRAIGEFESQLVAALAEPSPLTADDVRRIADTLRARLLTDAPNDPFSVEYRNLLARLGASVVRRDLLGRLIVSRFEHLFDHGRDVRLSRRVLPGFFLAVKMMVGSSTLQQYLIQTHRIMKRLAPELEGSAAEIDETGVSVDASFWTPLYEDAESIEILRHIFVRIALRFEDYPRRKRWLISIVNKANKERKQDDNRTSDMLSLTPADWAMEGLHFIALFGTIVADLETLLADDVARRKLVEDSGEDTVTVLRDVIAAYHRDASDSADGAAGRGAVR